MAISLFQRLSSSSPNNVIRLSEQYRMNRRLNALANKLTYGGHLVCANREVESATLRIQISYPCPPWLARVGQEGLDHAIIFLDTSLLPIQGLV